MGAYFYPRLVAVVNDHPNCNRLVNEQATSKHAVRRARRDRYSYLCAADIRLFYSVQFTEALDVLRWICLGIALRVITWPMGFIIVAKNSRLIFLYAEVAWTIVNVGHRWICVNAFGLTGAGMAFARIICISRIDDLSHRPRAQRVSLVGRKSRNWLPLCCAIAIVFPASRFCHGRSRPRLEP
jgi:hypothetical protein